MNPRNFIRKLMPYLCVGMLALVASADPAVPPAGAIFVNGATGNDRTGQGTIASPYATMDKGLDAAFTDVQTSTTNAVTDNLRHLFDAAVLYADGTTTAALATTPGTAALIVGNGNIYNRTADLTIKNELVRMGYQVRVVDDWELQTGDYLSVIPNLFTTADANTKDILIISGTANSGTMDALRDVTVPVVLMNPDTWRRWGFFDAGTDSGNGQTGSAIDILAPGNALAAGLSGTGVNVYSHPTGLSIVDTTAVIPAAGVVKVATVAGQASNLCLWTMAAGQTRGTDATNNAGNPTASNPAIAVGFLLYGIGPSLGGSSPDTDFISSFSAPYMVGTSSSNSVPVFDDRLGAPVENICVAAGTYTLDNPMGLFRSVYLQGGWNSTFDDQASTRTTAIDGQLKTRLIYAGNRVPKYAYGNDSASATSYSGDPQYSNCDAATVDSITLENGRVYLGALCGGAVFASNQVNQLTFSKCLFYNNASDGRGGAVFDDGDWSSIHFNDCTFTSNTTLNRGNTTNRTSDGGVIGSNRGAALYFNRCLFTGNNSTVTRASLIATRAGSTRQIQIYNCLFVDNQTSDSLNAGDGYMIELDGGEKGELSRSSTINNTFYNNRSTAAILRQADNAGNNPRFTMANNLFLTNSAVGTSTSTLINNSAPVDGNFRIVANNLVWNNSRFDTDNDGSLNVGIDNNISGDPMLVDPANGDFHLQAGSAAVDAGLIQPTIHEDYDGALRPQPYPQGRYDIGAFELPQANVNAVRNWTLF